jgi:uncharacterized damage-inducible protein DinB
MTRFALLLCVAASTVMAQNPISGDIKMVYTSTKNNIMKAADKMTEADYAFKPTPDVRSFGQMLGHIADAQYMFCGATKADQKRMGIEKSKTTKADLTAALKEAFAYCDAVYDGMTDEDGKAMVKFFGGERTKLGVLAFNNAHNMEHYGNMVTYMRLKGQVPPSSEGRR